MEGKKTAGRQKVPLVKIENEANRYAAYSKRRSGLFKTASELVRGCGVDLGIVLSSPTGKPLSFVHPTADVVIDRFMNPTQELSLGAQLVAAQARNKVNQHNARLNELEAREKAANENIHFLDQMNESIDIGQWENIDELSADDIVKFEAWLDMAESNMIKRLEKLQGGASPSSQPPSENADN
ncbi:hypothetical protein HAX54_050997 [Datura stramonium]|uniref:MADS-box domain-containing protein n=1 Tax=Datura stramonium TaxID=4076 RepID=A0ABS8RRK8_DATST|nr:hypothetical protein [Datura stramonium]